MFEQSARSPGRCCDPDLGNGDIHKVVHRSSAQPLLTIAVKTCDHAGMNVPAASLRCSQTVSPPDRRTPHGADTPAHRIGDPWRGQSSPTRSGCDDRRCSEQRAPDPIILSIPHVRPTKRLRRLNRDGQWVHGDSSLQAKRLRAPREQTVTAIRRARIKALCAGCRSHRSEIDSRAVRRNGGTSGRVAEMPSARQSMAIHGSGRRASCSCSCAARLSRVMRHCIAGGRQFMLGPEIDKGVTRRPTLRASANFER
jgi:hypothetical protein